MSYEELLLGDPLHGPGQRPARGDPPGRRRAGGAARRPAGGDQLRRDEHGAGQARKSRLAEIMSGKTLLAGAGGHAPPIPTPPATTRDHSQDAQRWPRSACSTNGWTWAASTTTTCSTARQRRAQRRPRLRRRPASPQARCMPVLHGQLRERPATRPVGSNQTGANGTPFRENRLCPHRQCRGRLQRDPVDDLRHLQHGGQQCCCAGGRRRCRTRPVRHRADGGGAGRPARAGYNGHRQLDQRADAPADDA